MFKKKTAAEKCKMKTNQTKMLVVSLLSLNDTLKSLSDHLQSPCLEDMTNLAEQ